MVVNIKEIVLGDSLNGNGIRPVKIIFKFPCTYTCLDIEDLKQILRLWIIGEELKYSRSEGFKGRLLLFEEISKVFIETEGGMI